MRTPYARKGRYNKRLDALTRTIRLLRLRSGRMLDARIFYMRPHGHEPYDGWRVGRGLWVRASSLQPTAKWCLRTNTLDRQCMPAWKRSVRRGPNGMLYRLGRAACSERTRHINDFS